MSIGICRTGSIKSACWLLYSTPDAKLVSVEPAPNRPPGNFHFVIDGVPLDAPTSPSETDEVNISRYLQIFDKLKSALTYSSRNAVWRP